MLPCFRATCVPGKFDPSDPEQFAAVLSTLGGSEPADALGWGCQRAGVGVTPAFPSAGSSSVFRKRQENQGWGAAGEVEGPGRCRSWTRALHSCAPSGPRSPPLGQKGDQSWLSCGEAQGPSRCLFSSPNIVILWGVLVQPQKQKGSGPCRLWVSFPCRARGLTVAGLP